jgi:hypothetical protein
VDAGIDPGLRDEHRHEEGERRDEDAVLVAQTRIESGIHTATEVAIGGLLGTLVTLVLFQTLT